MQFPSKNHLGNHCLNTIVILFILSIYSIRIDAQNSTKNDPVTITFENLCSIKPSFLYQNDKRIYFADKKDKIYIAQKMSFYEIEDVYTKPTFLSFKDSLTRKISSLSDLISYNVNTDSANKNLLSLKINYTVNTDSTISDISYSIPKEIFHNAKGSKIEILNTITLLISNQKMWQPARFDTLKVNCKMSEVIEILCTPKELIDLKQKSEDYLLIDPTIMPEYPGGTQEKTTYLLRNTFGVQVPKEYKKKNENFKVRVTYTIEKDGEVTNVRLARNGDKLDEFSQLLIINAFLNMPKWSPGKIGEVPKRLRFSTDLKF